MMPFSDEIINRAWQRALSRCECTRQTHSHLYIRCDNKLVWENRGREGQGAWEAHHRTETGGDPYSNCEILCWICHKKTLQ